MMQRGQTDRAELSFTALCVWKCQSHSQQWKLATYNCMSDKRSYSPFFSPLGVCVWMCVSKDVSLSVMTSPLIYCSALTFPVCSLLSCTWASVNSWLETCLPEHTMEKAAFARRAVLVKSGLHNPPPLITEPGLSFRWLLRNSSYWRKPNVTQ